MTDMDKEMLAERVRGLLPDEGITRKAMFGSICFLLNGNLLCGAGKKGLMIRIEPAREAEALASRHVAPIHMQARKMPGFLRVGPDGLLTDEDLERWVSLAMDYVGEMKGK